MWRSSRKSTVQIRSSSSPSSPFSCSSFKDILTLFSDENQIASSRRTASVFHRVRLAHSLLRTWSTQLHSLTPPPPPEPDAAVPEPPPSISIPGAEQRVVVYFTSLRVVRSTFEDCRAVRSILRGFRVQLDERDLSMDSGFVREMQGIMGMKEMSLPRVFIGGRYIGGAEEVMRLHESGELKNLMEGLPAEDPGLCHVCDGHRFVLCDDCDGSRKLYTEKSGFKTCTACNEYGLIRCPSCSCVS